MDHSSGGQTPTATDITLGTGDGSTDQFALIKCYEDVIRPITRPVADSVLVAVNGLTVTHTLLDGGIVQIAPPAMGDIITAGFLFDVPVRFDTEGLTLSLDTHGAVSVSDVPLIEVFEDFGHA